MTRDRPTWQPIWLACKCGEKWDDWQPCNVPVDTWVAHCRTYRCPRCGGGAGRVLLRGYPLPPEATANSE